MSNGDDVFVNLRQKLDVLGFTQSLPFSAVPLVGALFEDLIKTTESLRDAKKKIVDLLEEKQCWDLGVEPYKCDNSRLLAECNQLHMQQMKEHEDFEHRIYESNQKIRHLQLDKQHLDEHCQQLQQQMKMLLAKQSSAGGTALTKNMKEANPKSKKPFISTVRSGEMLFSGKTLSDVISIKCSKCNAGYYHKPAATAGDKHAELVATAELEKLDSQIKDLKDQTEFYRRKVEARDREIQRLNALLTGGRPPAALARDCCYKNVGALNEDIEILQRDKNENLHKIREYREQMHEAMQRALDLETRNKQLDQELEELREVALRVERQANAEIAVQDRQLEELRDTVKVLCATSEKSDSAKTSTTKVDKLQVNERLHELTRKETEWKMKIEHLQKKVQKLKSKLTILQKELLDSAECKDNHLDEEKIRLKSERDFFQKEYLRMCSKSGSDKEISFLQSQVKSKDEELRLMRSELCLRQVAAGVEGNSICKDVGNAFASQPVSARSNNSLSSNSKSSDCIQAVVLRAERERDELKKELEHMRCERDTLREKHICMSQRRFDETKHTQQHVDELVERVRQLERNNCELKSVQQPSETQIVLLKEEVDDLKQRIQEMQRENVKLKTSQTQQKILYEQAERALMENQTKLNLAERQLETADSRLNTLDTNRETTQQETMQLKSEVEALKKTYLTVENEKDKYLAQLDAKTEHAIRLEYELKAYQSKCTTLDRQVTDLEQQLEKLSNKTRERATELHETSTESKSLRQQITALKVSRDEAIAENGRLSNELAECQAEIMSLKKRLKDSQTEIERLKQQLRQYVQEVKKAEDLLLHKEEEREEMLEHYRSLSHDAVLLEGNNQSLEVEAAECKRQLRELEADIEALKKDVSCGKDTIDKLEDKVAALTAQNSNLERQLEEAIDDQRLLKVDLSARKELCDRLDNEKEKLNAELNELNLIRRKLENENEKLRADFEKSAPSVNDYAINSVPTAALEELLTKTRRELEEQIHVDSKLSLELVRLRHQNDELLHELEGEREKRKQHETLAHEYHIQNQELRHNLTDDRFRQARSREQSPRFPAQTM